MIGILSLLGTIGLAAVAAGVNTHEKIDNARIDRQERELMSGTDRDRQTRLYVQFLKRGVDVDGNPIKEPHEYPKEAMRLVKRQLEKEGIKYYNYSMWRLDNCIFDDEGHILSCGGYKFNRETGMFNSYKG